MSESSIFWIEHDHRVMTAEERAAFDAEPRRHERMKILSEAWSRFLQSADGR
jgi:hypothetical protein